MNTVELLESAKALIIDPDRWTKSEYARSVNYEACSPNSDAAFCWCALGAVRKAGDFRSDGNPGRDYLEKVIASDGKYISVDDFNDLPDTTHSDVISLFDRAIELAKEEA